MAKAGGLHDTSKFVWGGVLLLLGTALLLDNLEVVELGSVWKYWPFILVAIGIGKLLGANNSKERGDGLWWIFLGAWFYVSVFHVFGLTFSTSWPLLLVGIGASMVWRSLSRGDKPSQGEPV